MKFLPEWSSFGCFNTLKVEGVGQKGFLLSEGNDMQYRVNVNILKLVYSRIRSLSMSQNLLNLINTDEVLMPLQRQPRYMSVWPF